MTPLYPGATARVSPRAKLTHCTHSLLCHRHRSTQWGSRGARRAKESTNLGRFAEATWPAITNNDSEPSPDRATARYGFAESGDRLKWTGGGNRCGDPPLRPYPEAL